MQHLTKLRGEAENLVQHLKINSDNYETCLDILENRYNNKKVMLSNYIKNLPNISSSKQQSLNHIKIYTTPLTNTLVRPRI